MVSCNDIADPLYYILNIMKILLLIIELVSAIGLVITVLLHSAKGEGLGGIGGQARLFNVQNDMESGLRKFTMTLAIAFVLSAGILGVFY